MLNLVKVNKALIAANPQYWTCARCGTTNMWGNVFCTQCKNRRPA